MSSSWYSNYEIIKNTDPNMHVSSGWLWLVDHSHYGSSFHACRSLIQSQAPHVYLSGCHAFLYYHTLSWWLPRLSVLPHFISVAATPFCITMHLLGGCKACILVGLLALFRDVVDTAFVWAMLFWKLLFKFALWELHICTQCILITSTPHCPRLPDPHYHIPSLNTSCPPCFI